MVVLLPDHGRGYLSKIFDDDWMRAQGFDPDAVIPASDIPGRIPALPTDPHPETDTALAGEGDQA